VGNADGVERGGGRLEGDPLGVEVENFKKGKLPDLGASPLLLFRVDELRLTGREDELGEVSVEALPGPDAGAAKEVRARCCGLLNGGSPIRPGTLPR